MIHLTKIRYTKLGIFPLLWFWRRKVDKNIVVKCKVVLRLLPVENTTPPTTRPLWEWRMTEPGVLLIQPVNLMASYTTEQTAWWKPQLNHLRAITLTYTHTETQFGGGRIQWKEGKEEDFRFLLYVPTFLLCQNQSVWMKVGGQTDPPTPRYFLP